MEMIEYYKQVLNKYATFSGRARRSEFWYFTLVNLIIGIVLANLIGQIGRLLYFVYTLALLIPSLAVSTRRLHDTNHSAWWLFILLIPLVGAIVWIVFMATDSNPIENRYGPNPKGSAAPTPTPLAQ